MPILYIDKKVLTENIAITKEIASNAKIIGIVKENGYGLGLIPYSHLLLENGIYTLAVSSLEEAVILRDSGIWCDILLLCPLYKKTEIIKAFQYDLILSISSFTCGILAEEAASELSSWYEAHLCIDTGLGRYGFPCNNIDEILSMIKQMRHIEITGTNVKIGDTVRFPVNPIYVDSSIERRY